ncbi:MAG: hypothetical protein WCO55_00295 [Candidatus Falkowbacteria bacterium]
MKRLYLILALALLLCLVSCREAKVSITSNGQKIEMDEASGNTSPERFLGINRMQEETMTLAEMEKQQRLAVKSGKLSLADSLQDLIDRKKYRGGGFSAIPAAGIIHTVNAVPPARTTPVTGKVVKLEMVNTSKDDVLVLNGPFAGTTLMSGKKTAKAMPWPEGIFLLEYEIFPIGQSYSFKRRINVRIPAERTEPIGFY